MQKSDLLFLIGVILGTSSSIIAQTTEITYPPEFEEIFPIYEKALGDFHKPISSENELAQRYFDQGYQMMYAFTKQDAARSFREAWKADPNCAICYWGEAWAWGSYLNGKMRSSEAPRAFTAIQKAKELADQGYASQKKKILLMQWQYVMHLNLMKKIKLS